MSTWLTHGGRRKIAAQVRRYYSSIPKEVIACVVKVCRVCNARRTANKAYFAEPDCHHKVWNRQLIALGDINQGIYTIVTESPNTSITYASCLIASGAVGQINDHLTKPYLALHTVMVLVLATCLMFAP